MPTPIITVKKKQSEDGVYGGKNKHTTHVGKSQTRNFDVYYKQCKESTANTYL